MDTPPFNILHANNFHASFSFYIISHRCNVRICLKKSLHKELDLILNQKAFFIFFTGADNTNEKFTQITPKTKHILILFKALRLIVF